MADDPNELITRIRDLVVEWAKQRNLPPKLTEALAAEILGKLTELERKVEKDKPPEH